MCVCVCVCVCVCCRFKRKLKAATIETYGEFIQRAIFCLFVRSFVRLIYHLLDKHYCARDVGSDVLSLWEYSY